MAGTKQFNEDEALDRALDLFWRRGFGHTSMQDLAQATGVMRGSLYHAYGDKQAIFLRVFERYKERFLAGVREALSAPSVDDALEQYFRFSIATMTDPDGGDASRGCLSTKTATDETAMDAAIRQALRGLLDGLRQLVEERLSRADARNRLPLPPAAAATLIVTLTRGIVVMERIYQDPAQLEAMSHAFVQLVLPAKR